ncbi:glycoside hydrolase family 6 protein [Nocardiopsis sp. CNT312]|uniref:glycoside hydrolase family 6 protein n=1 Tax=Nocardiopsis sp. CNT312 TaxID=1137268 RepID=UPI00048F7EBB|nr:glycoside hydrolase family 6 protein [Nocardiopsis sp. CNT312]
MSTPRRVPGTGSAARRGLAATFALVLGGALAAVVFPTSASADTQCEVDYQVANDWGSGFVASVEITNLGDPADGWDLSWDYAGDQQITNMWNAAYEQSGQSVTASDVGYNGSIGSGSSVSFGFQGTYSGANPVPTEFTLNGTVCQGEVDPDPTEDPTDEPTDEPTEEPTEDPTDEPTDEPGERVDNPYVGADVYVNPVWSANAAAEPGGEAVADEPTGVWLDRIGAIEGNDSPTTGSYGLRDHLDEALEQADGDPLVFQVVIYNLPGRDCAALASNGELGPDEIDRYKNEYIDPIADILADYEDTSLRVVATIEIDSLPNLVTNVGSRPTATPECDEMLANGNYVEGVGYALSTLGDIGNVYNYVDAGHHGWIGWDTNFTPSAELFYEAANAAGATPGDVHGFIANTANYSALEEPHIDVDGVINGVLVRQSDWVDWNHYVDELSFAQALRTELVSTGFDSDIGMLIDTSRNGWGGDERPSGPSSSTDLNTYIEESRIDRRIHVGNWCNQAGAGLGERPQTAPEPGIDAYVWMKPPGESDGSSELIPNDEGKGFDRMCDPTYGGNVLNGNNPSGALPDAPVAGHWFSAQFQELLDNAYPPLD